MDDKWTSYLVRGAATVLILYFGYLGIQRIVVDHVRALQGVQQAKTRIERDAKRIAALNKQNILCTSKLGEKKTAVKK